MKNPILIFISFSLLLFGCKKDFEDDPVSYPENYEVDINDDGTIDFEVQYKKNKSVGLYGSTSGSVLGSINPKQGVFTLSNSYYLFLSQNDTIYSQPTIGEWYSYNSGIISKNWTESNGWNQHWIIISELSEYYFAFKLENGINNQIGWMKLGINTTTGDISILNSALTSNDTLIIN